jgi:hypothetical protein
MYDKVTSVGQVLLHILHWGMGSLIMSHGIHVSMKSVDDKKEFFFANLVV